MKENTITNEEAETLAQKVISQIRERLTLREAMNFNTKLKDAENLSGLDRLNFIMAVCKSAKQAYLDSRLF